MIENPIEFFIEKIKQKDYFSLVGYSDAEWFCILRHRIGEKTSLGQLLTIEVGDILAEILLRRQSDTRFLFAAPKALWEWPEFVGSGITAKIQLFLNLNKVKKEWYERDMITDDLARDAGLFPLISQLRESTVTMIGPHALEGTDVGFPVEQFIGISSPNLHKKPIEIEQVVNRCIQKNVQGVYLVSAGVSAAILIDKLHDNIPNSFFFDCGSMWDAFAGIGGQREWRAKLYEDPDKRHEWIRRNIYGS